MGIQPLISKTQNLHLAGKEGSADLTMKSDLLKSTFSGHKNKYPAYLPD